MSATTTEYERFVEDFHAACEEQARADAKKRRCEEFLKIAFSEIVNQHHAMPVSKAEHLARSSEYYISKTEELCAAQLASNLANAAVKAMELRFEMFRSRNANRRAELTRM